MLDLGANVNCTPEQLVQFAVMGAALAAAVDGIEQPTVGLLNIGEEDIKGNDVVKEAAELLKASGLNFHGNVEGNDIFKGTTDVVVCDGFVGNVALKTSEGLAQMLYEFLKAEFTRNPLTKLAALVAYPVLQAFKRRIDPRRYNGATLIGLKGIVVKSHGGADKLAFSVRDRQGLRRSDATACSTRSRSGWRRCREPAPGVDRRARPMPPRAEPSVHSRIAGTGSYLPAQRRHQRRPRAARRHQRRLDRRAHRHPRSATSPPTTRRPPTSRCAASRRALDAAGIAAADVDLIVVATTTPDMIFPVDGLHPPGQARRRRRARRSTCRRCARGFVYALALADKMVASGSARNALVVGAEIYSRILDWNDRGTCVLFGDGAGAVVLLPQRSARASSSTHLHADGSHADILEVAGPRRATA